MIFIEKVRAAHKALGLPTDDVTVHAHRRGGNYGAVSSPLLQVCLPPQASENTARLGVPADYVHLAETPSG